ncbi:hypothetical protein HanIR_Chr01g0034491 [Helianthus annuus]|nr:hypothetical protein HanIR_Chr01g0034491 [Helianthus annuus]
MGLKEALRLKSFDSKELDVRATKTPKRDHPYLTVVKENLYPIREPAGEVGQGGSASGPLGQGANAALVQTAPVVGGNKRKETGSSDPKDAGSKVVLYGSVHMSVEDEGVNAEGDENEEDNGEFRPQVSFKRRRGTSSKAGPNPKKLKKTKGDKKIVVSDDEVDQVTGFSVAGSLLENIDADLHGGKTPRDQPINLPLIPLSFGGPTTKVIEDFNMPDPLSFKKIEPSPSGKPTTGVASNVSRPSSQQFDGGDSASSSPLWHETEAVFICRELGSGEAVDVDSAHALEKYVPEWSLANKGRIMDALSAKMALFHLGTPAERAYYRKMSGPELGNALMLNQAQSNSLVVEAYKRWVEAESNCSWFEREVSEAKEVSKASQASAAAAYEARDKAARDLEDVKLKFEELKKKLSEVEEKNEAKQKEIQSSYDQLLTDNIRLVNDKLELERARDRAIKSHQIMIDDNKDMLTRYDGEMVEMYGLVSELMLTKQWFLTEGV